MKTICVNLCESVVQSESVVQKGWIPKDPANPHNA